MDEYQKMLVALIEEIKNDESCSSQLQELANDFANNIMELDIAENPEEFDV